MSEGLTDITGSGIGWFIIKKYNITLLGSFYGRRGLGTQISGKPFHSGYYSFGVGYDSSAGATDIWGIIFVSPKTEISGKNICERISFRRCHKKKYNKNNEKLAPLFASEVVQRRGWLSYR